MTRVVVIGGGISGLASAFRIQERAKAAGEAVEITVLEAGDSLGGKIRSDRSDGWIVETGPNGWLDSKPGTVKLVADLGIEDRVIPADDASKIRYLFVDGRLKALPTSPPAFMTSSVLPIGGRLRVMLEPFQKIGPPDETLAEFGRRRLGRHAVERLLDPFVTGIYAGDVETLSVAAAFPAVKNLEQTYGGLIKGMRARARERRETGEQAKGGAAGPGGHLNSLQGGLSTLIEVLAQQVDARIVTGTAVRRISSGEGQGYRVETADERLDADFVVCATPAPAAADYIEGLEPDIAALLRETPYVSVTVVGLGFPLEGLGNDLRGFGYLIPSREQRRILGCLWSSSIYPSARAPEGHALLRIMVGGARHPELAGLPDDDLLTLVREELEATMGLVWREPTHLRIFRWPAAIPQYPVGHVARLASMEQKLDARPGLTITGNHLYGIGINDCTADAERIGERFGSWLEQRAAR